MLLRTLKAITCHGARSATMPYGLRFLTCFRCVAYPVAPPSALTLLPSVNGSQKQAQILPDLLSHLAVHECPVFQSHPVSAHHKHELAHWFLPIDFHQTPSCKIRGLLPYHDTAYSWLCRSKLTLVSRCATPYLTPVSCCLTNYTDKQ